MGAVAVPLSFLFGPDALEYRLDNSEARVAFVDPQSLPQPRADPREAAAACARRSACAGARGADLVDYDSVVARGVAASSIAVATRADDPALIVYTSGTTGPPKGALMPHRCLLGNLPGFVHSHDGYPQPRDLFWSPADWAWTGGLMDALLPTLYFGQPIVGYRGRFDPERALRLIEKYQVRNTFLFPDRAEAHDEGVSRAARALRHRPAHDHERRRVGRHDGVRVGAAKRSASRSTRCSARPR